MLLEVFGRCASVAAIVVLASGLGCRATVPAGTDEAALPSASAPSDESGCEQELASPAFSALLADLKESAKAPEVWPGAHLARSDLILEWRGDDASCSVHWSSGEVVAVARASTPIASPLGLFGFVITERARDSEDKRGGFFTGDVPEPLVASLRAREVRAALHWVVNTETVAPPDFYPSEPALQRSLTHFLLHHEWAHVQQLILPMFGGGGSHARPSWAVQPDKVQLVARCYEAEDVRDLFARERASIADAVAAVESGDSAEATRQARAYMELRAERYAALNEVRVPSQGGMEVSCEEAEAVWELDEGGAEYVALASLWALEIPLPKGRSLSEHIRDSGEGNAPYYYTGAGQLLVLRHLLGERMHEVLEAILTSKSPSDGIHGQLRSHLSSR